MRLALLAIALLCACATAPRTQDYVREIGERRARRGVVQVDFDGLPLSIDKDAVVLALGQDLALEHQQKIRSARARGEVFEIDYALFLGPLEGSGRLPPAPKLRLPEKK